MRYLLYNPLSTKALSTKELKHTIKELDASKELKVIDVIKLEDKKTFLDSLKDDDDAVICGGDGTLNHLINEYDFSNFKNNIYIYKFGNGNDFLRDINSFKENFILINPYLVNNPTVIINDKKYKFINGIGFGIDGLVCVESDRLKKEGKKNINYTTLAIKLVLNKYKKVNAHVEVDGKVYDYKNVFIASTMNGKYYGGGMKVAPDQNRMCDTVTVCIWHGLNRISGLMLFPKIFKGKHVKNKKKVTILTGKHVKVTFDKPTALQIDGESHDKILSYQVYK